MRNQNMNRGMCKSREFSGVEAPQWAKFVSRYEDVWYFEECIKQLNGTRFMQVGASYPDDEGVPRYRASTLKGYSYYYELPRLASAPVKAAAPYGVGSDVLPPTPHSTMYLNVPANRKLSMRPSGHTDNLLLEMRRMPSSAGDSRVIAMSISPETALDLACDLTRMALAQKRKAEQQ